MVPQIQGTRTWANFGRWWGPGRPGLLQSMGSQRVEHDLVTEQQQYISLSLTEKFRFTCCLTYLPSTFKKRKRKKVQSFSRFQLFATPWTVAYQALPSMEFSRHEYWSGDLSFSRGSSRHRDQTWVSHIAARCFTIWATGETSSLFKLLFKMGKWSGLQQSRPAKECTCLLVFQGLSH